MGQVPIAPMAAAGGMLMAENAQRMNAEQEGEDAKNLHPKAPAPPQGWDQKAKTGAATYADVYAARKAAGLTK